MTRKIIPLHPDPLSREERIQFYRKASRPVDWLDVLEVLSILAGLVLGFVLGLMFL